MDKLDTYVYVDVSNIRNACRRSCGFDLDFCRLYEYLGQKYLSLKEVRYYEGIATDDKVKREKLQSLKEIGYELCLLERKSYRDSPRYAKICCNKCGHENKVQVAPEIRKMKSNIDVYLAADMIERVATLRCSSLVIIVSCDGDYAEAIRSALRLNPDVCIAVLATPRKIKNNCLSVRLMDLSEELPRNNYKLINIENIKDRVNVKRLKCK